MKYMLLIYADEDEWESVADDERQQVRARYDALTAAMRESGALVGGGQLKGTQTATVVRQHDGQTLVADGPFAETKEHLGGYFMVECATLDDAIAWAARIPAAERGAIEVRPLVE